MANLPMFAAGKYESIQPAIEATVLTYPAFVYVSDMERLAYIDKDSNVNLIKGDPAEAGVSGQIEWVDELPEDGETEVLYIYNNTIYTYDGEDYTSVTVDTDALESLKEEVEALTEQVEEATSKVEEISAAVEEVSATVEEISETVESVTETVTSLEEKVEEVEQTVEEAVSSVVVGDELPEVGEEGKIYVDTSEDDEQKGVYVYVVETGEYVKIADLSTTEEETTVEFIELDEIEYTMSVETYEALVEAIDNVAVAEITITDAITANKCVKVANGHSKTINIEADITAVPEDGYTQAVAVMANNGSMVTINADDSVSISGGEGASDSNVAVWSNGTGTKVVINGGSYDVGLDANGGTNSTVYAADGGEIEIYGGVFKNSGNGLVLNVKNDSGSSITCYGGTYISQSPLDGDDSGSPESFVAGGYAVTSETENGITTYTVIPEG